jgi:hypothetical protein
VKVDGKEERKGKTGRKSTGDPQTREDYTPARNRQGNCLSRPLRKEGRRGRGGGVSHSESRGERSMVRLGGMAIGKGRRGRSASMVGGRVRTVTMKERIASRGWMLVKKANKHREGFANALSRPRHNHGADKVKLLKRSVRRKSAEKKSLNRKKYLSN